MTILTKPEDCGSMTELREQIDAIDVMLLELLATRSDYIDRAVELKRIEGLPARTVDRVAAVLANVKSRATQVGLDEKLWKELIEWAIQREAKHLS